MRSASLEAQNLAQCWPMIWHILQLTVWHKGFYMILFIFLQESSRSSWLRIPYQISRDMILVLVMFFLSVWSTDHVQPICHVKIWNLANAWFHFPKMCEQYCSNIALPYIMLILSGKYQELTSSSDTGHSLLSSVMPFWELCAESLAVVMHTSY